MPSSVRFRIQREQKCMRCIRRPKLVYAVKRPSSENRLYKNLGSNSLKKSKLKTSMNSSTSHYLIWTRRAGNRRWWSMTWKSEDVLRRCCVLNPPISQRKPALNAVSALSKLWSLFAESGKRHVRRDQNPVVTGDF